MLKLEFGKDDILRFNKTRADAKVRLDEYLKEDKRDRVAVISGGIGDFIALDSFMNDKEKNWFNVVYQVGYRPPSYESLFLNYHNVEKYRYFWDFCGDKHRTASMRNFIHRSLRRVRNTRFYVGPAASCVHSSDPSLDMPRCKNIFKEVAEGRRNYAGCTFIANKMADISKFQLPQEYVVICPATINAQAEWDYRVFDEVDWGSIEEFLVVHDLWGVVLGLDCASYEHCNVINLSDKTTLLEAIEISKNSVGYIGVDSVFSVVVARVRPPNRVLVLAKQSRGAIWRNKTAYYPFGANVIRNLPREIDRYSKAWF